MQIIYNLLRVIFMLSTIVTFTDCCSSRILLLREQNLEIVHDYNIHITPEQYATSDVLEETIESFMRQLSTMKEKLQNETKTAMLSTSNPLQPLDTGQLETTSNPTTTIDDSTTSAAAAAAASIENECPYEHKTNFCLNGGICFSTVFNQGSPMYSCRCAMGFAGERCEGKLSFTEEFTPDLASQLKQETKVAMARIVFSFPMLLALSVLYIIIGALFIIRCPTQQSYQASGMLIS